MVRAAVGARARVVEEDRGERERSIDLEPVAEGPGERRREPVKQARMLARVPVREDADVEIVGEKPDVAGVPRRQKPRREGRRDAESGQKLRAAGRGHARRRAEVTIRARPRSAPADDMSLHDKQQLFADVRAPEALRRDPKLTLKACAICGARDARRIYQQAHFPVVKCRRCGLVYADEHFTAADLARFYSGDYYQRAYVCHPKEIDRKIAGDYADAFAMTAAARRGGRLLDFGSARGTFLAELKRRGVGERFELLGVDVNPDEVAMGVAQGLPVRRQDLLAEPLPPESFDVVTAFSVLEHMQDPAATLAALARVLKPGGELLLTLPAGDCLILWSAVVSSKLLGRAARAYSDNVFHEEHLYYFTPSTLAAAFRAAGLEPAWFKGAPSYLETHPPSAAIAVAAYALRAASWALRRQTMLVAAARKPAAV
jgi:SAM-dependent methyltransferase